MEGEPLPAASATTTEEFNEETLNLQINELKACVCNVPPAWTQKKWENFLKRHQVQYSKTRKIHKRSVAVMEFVDLDQKKKATEIIEAQTAKGKKLFVTKSMNKYQRQSAQANAEGDHSNAEKKRKRGDTLEGDIEALEDYPPSKKQKSANADEVANTAEDAVTPLWNVPYEQQLERKRNEMLAVLRKTVVQIRQDSYYDIPSWLKICKSGLCCPLERIVPSPRITGYRNKVIFAIGLDAEGRPCIGHTLGRIIEKVSTVGDPSRCPNIHPTALGLRNIMQGFIESSPLPPFSKLTKRGCWRALTVRTSETGQAMVVLQFSQQGAALAVGADHADAAPLTEQLTKEKERYVKLFHDAAAEGKISAMGIAGIENLSLKWQRYDGISNAPPPDLAAENVHGPNVIYEELSGLKFRISTNSFFQVNTKGAEALYAIAREWAAATPNSVVLDVCCGTGTIGITLANAVKYVVGVDNVEAAIVDARMNAQLNEVKNATFICGAAEKTLAGILAQYSTEDCIAIVDPPRGGLHNDTIKALRNNSAVRRLVYISCNPNSFVANAGALCRMPSKAQRSVPFRPVKAVAVDMFPHTEHCELVVLLERLESAPATTLGTTVEAPQT